MGFLKNRLKIRNEGIKLSDPNVANFFQNLGIDTGNISSTSELREVTYFICLKTLTETISKMKWLKRLETEKKGKEKVKDVTLSTLLNLRPNPLYNAATFWGSIELNRLHHGNAYAYINFKKGKPTDLWVLPSEEIEIWRDNKAIWGSENSIWYIWNDIKNGKKYRIQQGEMLHFKNSITFDGIVGMSVRDMLKNKIQGKIKASDYLSELYSSNMFGGKVIINYTSDINQRAEEKLIERLSTYIKKDAGKFIPLMPGMEAKVIDMKLSDAQFLENNKLSALEIAAAFGIKPNMINDYSKSSYSNSETQQLDFYVNTLQPAFNSYMQEVTYKLLPKFEILKGYTLEINEKILFKMDNKTKSEVYSSYLNNFVMTPNEVREELDLPYIEEADELIGNGNYIKMGQVGNQWNKGGE